MKPRVIVCAANRRINGSGLMVLGPRHHDATMNRLIASMRVTDVLWEQGFIDQQGVFLNRTEAWKVAEAAGQIQYRCGGDDADGGTLYSENLY